MDVASRFLDSITHDLKALNDEAGPLADGTATGIWWYHRFLQGTGPKPGKYRNEEKLFAALVERMARRGLQPRLEQCYPSEHRGRKKQRCDVVLDYPELGRTWLEVKCAWRHNDQLGKKRNGNYVKHLYRAADDVDKVCNVGPSTARHVALLLIGFDQDDDQISDGNIEIVRTRTRDKTWTERTATLDDPYRLKGKIKLWLWLRETKVH